jgi:hypothetical protein
MLILLKTRPFKCQTGVYEDPQQSASSTTCIIIYDTYSDITTSGFEADIIVALALMTAAMSDKMRHVELWWQGLVNGSRRLRSAL